MTLGDAALMKLDTAAARKSVFEMSFAPYHDEYKEGGGNIYDEYKKGGGNTGIRYIHQTLWSSDVMSKEGGGNMGI